ncbi:IS200/IS605 family element transposase accessory protein TnpB [Acidithiobacillus sp. CV18-2]|nr:IS200/IS605 family element transposase accessory protein TnpB [Acidithiobacillus sp. CV18-3]MBU2758358.1 IS200/IS605 family element transposase accessory protein TnpB [Acidithiobacillus sp. BN09-2]MBU2778217.1 IS200/IS605 family element transposase accessory protein TnpB [Acidithiobacillus sp. CV18-2]MBU2799090.1 IS200/IS605 family element transposase accessory protein TnpB [Acidithiobacillus sp. VAN18-4]
MKRTVSLKLVATPAQAAKLAELSSVFAQACAVVVPFSVEHRCWNRVALHHLAYRSIRDQFPALGSQMACNAIHRVASAYKTLQANKRIAKDKAVPVIRFDRTAVHYDHRTYSLREGAVSLFTMSGREVIAFSCGKHQANLMKSGDPKEAELVCRKGQWFFNLVLDIPDVAPVESGGILGVDVGENNLAATSSGKVLGGGKLCFERDKYLAHRRRLQSNGSRAAKRKLRAISGRERRHVEHVNHEVSKAIVQEAIRLHAGEIRMEDLTHIRDRIRAGKRVRTRLHRWAFRQLQDFVAYKAQGVGISVEYVNPAYTSQTCSVCGAIGKRVKHRFTCSCGNRRHSDVNASVNIAGFAEPIGPARAAVNQPVFAHLGHSCM